jgi:hypothetical protein
MKKFTRQQLIDKYFSGLNIEFDDSLINFKNYSVCANINMDQLELLETFQPSKSNNIESLYTNALYAELVQGINKELIKSFKTIGSIIELNGKEMHLLNRNFSNFIQMIDGSNFIVNSNIGSLFLDLPQFNTSSYTSTNYNSQIYKIGNVYNKVVSVDPLQTFNWSKLLSYDNIYINLIINEPKTDMSNNSFAPKTIIDFKFDFKILNPKINYVIDEFSSLNAKQEIKQELIRINREKVLNKLLYG